MSRASAAETRTIFSLLAFICFPRVNEAAGGAAPGDGDDVDAAVDLACAVDAGLAVIEAIVDVLGEGAVEQREHVDEIDAVFDKRGVPLVLVPLEGHWPSMWRDWRGVSIRLVVTRAGVIPALDLGAAEARRGVSDSPGGIRSTPPDRTESWPLQAALPRCTGDAFGSCGGSKKRR